MFLAIQNYKYAIRLKPLKLAYSLKRCDAHYERQEFKECVEVLKKVLKIDPKHLIAKFKLGRCYFELKEYKKSIKAFKNFLSQLQADSNEAVAKSLEKRSSFFITSVGVRVELAKPLDDKSQSDDA